VVLVALLGATWPSGRVPTESNSLGDPSSVEPTGLRIVLIGDSVAEQLGPTLREQAAARGIALQDDGVLGCLVMEGVGVRFPSGRTLAIKHCDARRAQWRRTIEKSAPDLVLILEGGTGIGERLVGDRWLRPCTPEFDEVLAADLTRAIRQFEQAGSRTVIVMAPPPRAVDVPPRFRELWGLGEQDSLERTLVERTHCQSRVRRQVAATTGAALVDLGQLTCPGGRCPEDVAGVRLRPDGIHFEGEGAIVAADWLLDGLEERGLLRQVGRSNAESARPARSGVR
jgi:lysophospholipase L1-like esterase